MQRALMWLNLYCRQAFRHDLKKGLKHKKCILRLLLFPAQNNTYLKICNTVCYVISEQSEL